jgi:hypothetical protein
MLVCDAFGLPPGHLILFLRAALTIIESLVSPAAEWAVLLKSQAFSATTALALYQIQQF